ncbi:DUF2000 domain-containing protein [Modestobacter roseus]|uniref:DUF2000 family protein n=1 Tax=Modestobacter roseus TaxID=1181884 RepID=A0A562INJ6_9ACTN|nr:DUF2000 domain-containing protein [Modestobacter roseus]MQA36315.1 DUF2000 family protein [Modestobacter roseus]TWH72599.1 hypothetical protein JD78_01115 [Modestobacter roseus]
METLLDPAAEAPVAGPPWPTKIAVLLREGLLPWQELNVTAFLSSAIAAAVPELIGAPYEDGDGTRYLAMFRQPVLVLTGPAQLLGSARTKALARGLPTSLFTADLFATGGDAENRAAVRAVPGADLDLVGLAVHGPRNAVDKILKGARMHA